MYIKKILTNKLRKVVLKYIKNERRRWCDHTQQSCDKCPYGYGIIAYDDSGIPIKDKKYCCSLANAIHGLIRASNKR